MTNEEIDIQCIDIMNHINAIFYSKYGPCRMENYPREDGRHCWLIRSVDDGGEPVEGGPRFEAIGYTEDRHDVLSVLLDRVSTGNT